MTILRSLLTVREALAGIALGPDQGSPTERYAAVVILKHVVSRCNKALKALEPELRDDVQDREPTREGRTYQVGDVIATRYADKPGNPTIKSVDAVKDLLRPKSKVAIRQVVQTVETVDVGALRALIETGHITQAEFDGVMVPGNDKKGSFTVKTTGALKRALGADDAGLAAFVERAGE